MNRGRGTARGIGALQRSHWKRCRAFALGFVLAAVGLTFAGARAEEPFLLLKLDGAYVKWGSPALGTGATVRYALLDRNADYPGARNCRSMVPLEPVLQRQGIAFERLKAEAAAAFAMWEQAADIRFEATDDPAEADILIGGQRNPRGRAFANVDFRSEDRGATRRIEKALICLNQAERWKVGFGGDGSAYDLRYTIAHEIGHAIGLNHPGPSGQLMGFRYAETFRALQPGDLTGAVALYGSRDGTATARVPSPETSPATEMGLR